ncbi:MAG: PilX N-terminal domain-containing pilus assembly protein [Nitrospirota bacterium]
MRMRMMRQDLVVPHRGDEGIALVTTLVILLIMTVLGVGAVAVTALENRIAGFQRTGESATSAAESCVGTSVNIIQQTLATSTLTVPVAFVSATGPVLTSAEVAANPSLSMEISGSSDNDTDLVTGAGAAGPDYRLQINGYTVLGDIDRLYLMGKAGSGMQFAAGYEGAGSGTAGGGADIVYRIDCRATLTAVGTESRVVAIYACTLNGQCQKKI